MLDLGEEGKGGLATRTVHEERADAEREEREEGDGVGGEAPVEGAWVVVGHAGGGGRVFRSLKRGGLRTGEGRRRVESEV